MSMMLPRIALGVVAVLLLLVIGGSLAVMTLAPDRHAPPEVGRILPNAKRYLAGRLDQPIALVRYVGWDTGNGTT